MARSLLEASKVLGGQGHAEQTRKCCQHRDQITRELQHDLMEQVRHES